MVSDLKDSNFTIIRAMINVQSKMGWIGVKKGEWKEKER